MFLEQPCPICDGPSTAHDVVDFNKSCRETHGQYLHMAGLPVYYALCAQCGFCFAPEFADWSLDDFSARIYNRDYELVDPDYVEVRPRVNAENLIGMFGSHTSSIRHLDYGGGNGLLSRLLRDLGWQSSSYDPFVDRKTRLDQLGRFNLVTAFEVFEHVPSTQRLASDLSSLIADDGILIFSTLPSDENIGPHQRLTWWYASPRNGHISLFSRSSLEIFAGRMGCKFGSLSPVHHVFWKTIPKWAEHVIHT